MFRKSPDYRDELIRAQQQMIADLMDRLQEMIGQVHYHQVQRAEAETQRLSNHVSEEEDDLRFAEANGFIDKQELEARLRELEFHNPNVVVEYP